MVLLKEQYGKQVVVNLLGSRGGEEVLNRAFKVTFTLLSSRRWVGREQSRGSLTLLPSRGWVGKGRVWDHSHGSFAAVRPRQPRLPEY